MLILGHPFTTMPFPNSLYFKSTRTRTVRCGQHTPIESVFDNDARAHKVRHQSCEVGIGKLSYPVKNDYS